MLGSTLSRFEPAAAMELALYNCATHTYIEYCDFTWLLPYSDIPTLRGTTIVTIRAGPVNKCLLIISINELVVLKTVCEYTV